MVRRDEAEPASRMPGRGGGMTGRIGSGWGVGMSTRRVLGGGFGAGLEAAFLAGLRPPGAVCFAAMPGAGRLAARARGALPRARAGFLAGFLEELTPEFSDLSDRGR